ncbi:TAXI family TRAP transporter solute-binding subunit [Caldimonas brevitalea]|uniref:C4-dicarboxylate ABC transporter substrate-binding protein n=1 Tax=Caldimonas brevitalea TaxID=413882 RepID=A0A0G3BXF7_9BURK|nr:TAXI family TRAP transporter solute-binding subunit [Caldimonas brevitalea]AKJ32056.1 C4-dicarboxylate ABC transporter substrate-binding protein [Caldimonas brevitalea]
MSFSRIKLLLLSLRDLIPAAAPFIVLAVALMAVAYWVLDPTPPKKLVMATGTEQGAYEVLGRRYRDLLAPYGITVELRPSAGSGDNLASLQRDDSGVDIAFVQGGTVRRQPGQEALPDLGLVSLGSLFYEPVWLFYREDSAKRLLRRPRLQSLSELKGWRFNAGSPGSGVQLLAAELLELNRIDPQELKLAHLPNTPAVVELLEGRSDAMLFVSAPDSPLIQMLLQTPGIRLFSFSQSQAYARKLPHLSAVTLPRGVVDLGHNLPAEDVQLIAPTATLMAREGLHPALIQLLMQAATHIHGEAGWFARAGEFPNALNTDLPVAAESQRYLRNGAPWLQRYLPFWVSNLIDRMWVALLSIVAALIPLSRLVPPLYEFRVRSRVFRWYARLREVEEGLERPDADTDVLLQKLDDVEAHALRISLPLSYADELYALRQHIDLVRGKLQLTRARQRGEGAPAGSVVG